MKKELLPHGKRILLIRLSSIGDVLHTTAVTRNLKRLVADCSLTWLASPPAAALLEGNPDIDRLLVWDRRPFDAAVSSAHARRALSLLGEARHLLRPHHEPSYDIVLDVQCLFLTGMLARMTGAKRRIGIRELREGNALFMTEVARESPSPHKIRRYMTALEPLGIEPGDFVPGLRLAVPESAEARAAELIDELDLTECGRPLLLVAVKTSWANKQPEPELFARALSPIAGRAAVVFVGAPGDAEPIERCRALIDAPTYSLAGRASLIELAALMRRAQGLLSCDSGPLYVAEAVGLPTVSLWGPTTPEVYGPLTEGHRFILPHRGCRGCLKTKCSHKNNGCINSLDTAEITKELSALLF